MNPQDVPKFDAPAYRPGSYWFPEQASTFAANVDWLFYFILWLSVFFFVVIVAVMVHFMIRYRRREGIGTEDSTHHNTPLEITWSVIPSLLVIYIFYEGFTGYLDIRTPPKVTTDVNVYAKQWNWMFNYAGTAPTSGFPRPSFFHPELHVVVNTPTKLIMRSDDVIHSLAIPAFRVKMDVMKGRFTEMWFVPTKIGEYSLFCTEYCGRLHSEMLAKVVVHEPASFDAWAEVASDVTKNPDGTKRTPEQIGQLIYQQRGCMGCHSIDGSAKQGPSFKGSYGTEQSLADGKKITVDENYIRESVINPMAKIRGGYKPGMPSFAGQLRDVEIDGVIAFIKSLKN